MTVVRSATKAGRDGAAGCGGRCRPWTVGPLGRLAALASWADDAAAFARVQALAGTGRILNLLASRLMVVAS